MATHTSPFDQLMKIVVLFALVVVSALVVVTTANFWLGFALLFIALPIYIILAGGNTDRLFLWLLGYLFLFTTILVTALLLPQFSADRALTGGNETTAFIFALLTGGVVAIIVTAAIFVLFVAGIAVGWYRDEGVGFGEIYSYIARSLLGLPVFSLSIVNGEVRGKAKEKERLEKFGGPGKIRVYSEQVVVFHRHDVITRAVGHGAVILKLKEQVKAIIPLGGTTKPQTIEKVLTRDRIPLTLTVVHGAVIEPADATDKRLAELKQADPRDEGDIRELEGIIGDGTRIGDEHDAVYLGMAKWMAAKAPDAWGATRGSIESGLRDVFMANDFEDLFQAEGDPDDIQLRIKERKLAKIEQFVHNQVKNSKIGDGVVLRFVDIGGVGFPEDLDGKMREEIAALMDARIRETKAKADERAAQFEAQADVTRAKTEVTVAQEKGRAITILAKAQAEAAGRKEDVKIRAKAESFKRVSNLLKAEGYSEETIREVMKGLATSSSLEEDFKRLMQMTQIPGQNKFANRVKDIEALPEGFN